MALSVSQANSLLRPSAAQLEEAWRVTVTAEREQVESLPNRPRPEDFYGPIAGQFRADPHRTDEPALDGIRALVRSEETWIDIGAGGGRYCLAIALLARKLYAIEPSQGMRETLVASATEHGVDNVEVFDERWPSTSDAPIADVSFISHVGYDIADIGPFLDEMEAHTRRLCVALLYQRTPLAEFASLWRPVHGEDRVLLPGLPELISLLLARGSLPQIDTFDVPRQPFADREALVRVAQRPLWVLEGTPEYERLVQAVQDLAFEAEGGIALQRGPRRLGLIRWEPRRR
jgi:hypothetical protein